MTGTALTGTTLMKKILPSKTSVLILLIVAFAFSAYSFAIQDSFKTLDDEKIIVANPDIRSFSRTAKIFTSSFFGRRSYYRPLVTFSHLLEYQVFGLKAEFYYLVNILIHIASALVLFALFQHFFKREMLSFLAALLFAVHPVQWEAVTNIPGRAVLLSAFFIFSSFYFFCRRGKGAGVLALLMFGAGLMCKESAGVFPLVLGAFQLTIPGGTPRSRRDVIARLRPVVPFFIAVFFYLLVRRWLGITNVFLWRSPPEAALGFLTFLRGLLTYLRLLIWPVDGHFDRARVLFSSFFQTELILTILFFLAVLFFVNRYRRLIPVEVKFFLAWPLIELIPVCQFPFAVGVQPGMISTAEHFMYLPMAGLSALGISAGYHLYRKMQARPGRPVSEIVWRAAVAGLYAYFLLFTVQMSLYSRDETLMFERSVRYNPHNVRILTSLAVRYARAGRYSEAEALFRRASRIDPHDVKARIGLGKVLCDQGQYWEGLAEYDKIERPGMYAETLATNRRLTYQILLRRLHKSRKKNPRDARVYHSLGVIHSKRGEPVLAREHFLKAVALDPGFREALFNLAQLEAVHGRTAQAIAHFERLLDHDRTGRLAYMALERLTELYRRAGAEAKSLQARQRADSLSREMGHP